MYDTFKLALSKPSPGRIMQTYFGANYALKAGSIRFCLWIIIRINVHVLVQEGAFLFGDWISEKLSHKYDVE